MPHPAMSPNNVAVITGGASGIGLAAATRFAAIGMNICIADIGAERLAEAAARLASVARGGAADIMTASVDVSRFDDLAGLETAVQKRFGGTDILMNNAGIGPDSTSLVPLENWQRILAVNLWGVIHGTQAFAPHMIERGRPGLIINTGSKQGITTPPGNPAYNVSKAGVKAQTEALQHELRNIPGCKISAHLMIPGHVFTPHCLKTYLTRVAPFSAWTRFGAPHLPQTASIRVLPCLTTRAFFSIVSRIRRSASSRIACFDIGLPRHEPLRRRSYHSHDAFRKSGRKICVTECQMASGVSASRRRTRASAVSVAGSAEITGTASAMTSIGSYDRTMRCVALLAASSDITRSTAGSDNVRPHGASGRRSTRRLDRKSRSSGGS